MWHKATTSSATRRLRPKTLKRTVRQNVEEEERVDRGYSRHKKVTDEKDEDGDAHACTYCSSLKVLELIITTTYMPFTFTLYVFVQFFRNFGSDTFICH